MADEVRPFQLTAIKRPALLSLDSNAYQYEWVEDEQRWVKFFDEDPDPPDNLPPGKFDGQIIDVQR